MATYTFECHSCQHIFMVNWPINDYDINIQTVECDICYSNNVSRAFNVDFASIHSNVKLGDDQLKLGHLAKRNSEKYSAEQKHHIFYENNKYKFQSTQLPDGTSVGKDKSLDEVKPSEGRKTRKSNRKPKT